MSSMVVLSPRSLGAGVASGVAQVRAGWCTGCQTYKPLFVGVAILADTSDLEIENLEDTQFQSALQKDTPTTAASALELYRCRVERKTWCSTPR